MSVDLNEIQRRAPSFNLTVPSYFVPGSIESHEFEAGMYAAIAQSEEPETFAETAYLYAGHFNLGIPINQLIFSLDQPKRKEVFQNASNLALLSGPMSWMFPNELQEGAQKAFQDLGSTLLWSFAVIAANGGQVGPSSVPLTSGREIPVRGFTHEQAVQTAQALTATSWLMRNVVASYDRWPVQRMNETGAFGMYRLGKEGDVIATVRPMAQPGYDSAVEYGSSSYGSQASIGFSVDLEGPYSIYKREHQNPFCIRIDNEGDQLALDVGSILGKPGTLGKDVADLITIGDYARLQSRFPERHSELSMNHSKLYFAQDMAQPETFAQMVAPFAARLENRWQATRGELPARLLLQAQTADA
ncbi:MAG: hypothetical protein KIH63_001405 [Candidatus Saccharibacteria bacterium]|nr:hypothetical protein [Candidatus Saccharibacteria bacterium]